MKGPVGNRALAITAAATLWQNVVAAPAMQLPFGLPDVSTTQFNPLHHMSGIAPYFDAPGASTSPPPHCNVSAAAFLIRHSSIHANDDEWEDYMEPFVKRVIAGQALGITTKDAGALAFLENWESPINDDNLEQITGPGKEDAFSMGKTMREMYEPLFPAKEIGKGKETTAKNNITTPFKVWTASSPRDIDSAKAWVRGAFPKHQEGGGKGDGKVISLIEVPNKDPNWAGSLTPHKICPNFSKEVGKPEALEWLNIFGAEPLQRIQKMLPHYNFELNDVIAMFMLCGYETVILPSRKSAFCSPELFGQHEFHGFGYWNDLKYHYQVGYGSELSPYLGIGWLNTSAHNLLNAYDPPHPHFADDSMKKKLPPPSAPPNNQHTQLLFPYFTHRQEPALALTALGIWNTTHLPSNHIDHNRSWKTSHVLPFLGHIALERISCPARGAPKGSRDKEDFIRTIVNGAVQYLDACMHGPGGSCPLGDFDNFVKERVERWHDFEGACGGIKG